MEDAEETSCKVVYFTTGDNVNLLYQAHAPPPKSVTNESEEQHKEGRSLPIILTDVRALLDRDRAAFHEVYISSSEEQCLSRLDAYAGASTVAVLVEVERHLGHATDRGFGFLRTLSSRIQGARFQRHVIAFAVLPEFRNKPQTPSPDASDAADYLRSGAEEILTTPLSSHDLNRLVGHVMELSRPPARLVGCSMAQNLVQSIRQTDTLDAATHRPDEIIHPERMEFIRCAVHQWAFPAHELDMDELTCAAMIMIERMLEADDVAQFRIPRADLMALLLATRRQYKHEKVVTYHNWRHAIDVTQSIFQFMTYIGLCPPTDPQTVKERTSVEKLVSPLDGLLLLVSAIGHDVGHPGVNNAFLVACGHPLAQLYNDKSVLENYHCSAYSQLLRRHWPALNRHPPFRTTLISNILATDMQRHFEYMSYLRELREKLADSDASVHSWNAKDKEHARELIMALMMKAADISNIARPFDISAAWAKILIGEFARQGELENELDIPTCLFGGPPDRDDLLAAAQSQQAFMNLFGFPLFRGLSDILPSISCSVETLEKNQKCWDARIAAETEKKNKRLSHATLDSLGTDCAVELRQKHRASDPAVVPVNAEQPPSTNGQWVTGEKRSSSPARSIRRSSSPMISSNSLHVTSMPSSRRSSKDVALDQLQQVSVFAHQNLPGSRRSSQEPSYRLAQSVPSSRRTSKDENLTTILVTSNDAQLTSPPRTAGKSRGAARKQSAAPSSTSHSHAASSATATTALSEQSPSTQPSSVTPHEDDEDALLDSDATPQLSIPLADSPTLADDILLLPRSCSSTTQSTLSGHANAEHIPQTPSSLLSSARSDTSPQMTSRTTTEDRLETTTSPVTNGNDDPDASLRGSRSRSRLRSLRFWKKKKDSIGGESVS